MEKYSYHILKNQKAEYKTVWVVKYDSLKIYIKIDMD
jgi:type I site-specific restriction-modification system R (restriction) subunit